MVDPEQTSDHEEKEQCSKMHDLIKQYKLDGEFRYGAKAPPCSDRAHQP